jgi:TonB family protein
VSVSRVFIAVSLAAVGIATPVIPQESTPLLSANTSSMSVTISKQLPVSPAPNPSKTSVPSYPDTPQGLEKLMKDMLNLEKQNNRQELVVYLKSMTLPDADNWFKSVFGDFNGAILASDSERERNEFQTIAPNSLATFQKQGFPEVRAFRFDDSCNRRATATEYPFLLLRQRPEPLYDVRFLQGNTGTLMTYFAYVDGAFRYIGSMKKVSVNNSIQRSHSQPSADQTSEPAQAAIRLGGNVASAKLIHQEVPVYRQEAKDNGIQGTVLLHAIIAKDGSIRVLDLREGVCLLAGSALDAVKKWRFKPTMLNGNPIEVDTTISVVFKLGG